MDFQKRTPFLTVKIESQNAAYRDRNGRPTRNLHHRSGITVIHKVSRNSCPLRSSYFGLINNEFE